jgi:hypothetical protein
MVEPERRSAATHVSWETETAQTRTA